MCENQAPPWCVHAPVLHLALLGRWLDVVEFRTVACDRRWRGGAPGGPEQGPGLTPARWQTSPRRKVRRAPIIRGMPLEMTRLTASELLSATRLRASRSAVLLVPRHKLALELFLSAGQRHTSILVVERLQLLAALVSASSIRSEGEE